MNKIALCLLFVFFYTSSAYAEFEGTYNFTGFDPYENKPYQGVVTITKNQSNVYHAKWKGNIAGKNWTAEGTGLQDGDGIYFIFQNSDNELGLQIYHIKGDILEGQFVLMNKDLVGNEKLQRMK